MKASFLSIFIVIIFASIYAHSQEARQARPVGPVIIRKIELSYVRNKSREQVTDRGTTDFARNRWGKIEVTFKTTAEFIDQIEFRYYLLMRNRRFVLTGSQTCMYVRKGNAHLTCIYVYPNAVEKYGGGILGIAVETYIDGKLVSLVVKGEKSQRWWETDKDIPDVMVNWHMTPFRRTGVEKYEPLKAQ